MSAMDMLKDISLPTSGSQKLSEALASLSEVGLSFPEIAVVGQESTGKSSVLERITMLPLFPRGEDIVTRSTSAPCPSPPSS